MTDLTPTPVPAPAAHAATYPAQPSRPTNILAILSISLVWINGIAGIVLGHLALSSIRKTGEEGRTLAIAGLIVGYTLTGLAILGLVAYLAFFVVIIMAGISHAGHSGFSN